eukprot:6678970-Alexandrium_andersonii.AAC.1
MPTSALAFFRRAFRSLLSPSARRRSPALRLGPRGQRGISSPLLRTSLGGVGSLVRHCGVAGVGVRVCLVVAKG